MRPFVFALIAAALAAGAARAGEPATAREILDLVRQQPTPEASAVMLRMTLVSNRGGKPYQQQRTVKMFAKRGAGGLKSLLKFTEPQDVAGVALLVVENKTGPDDQWLYMPALKQEPKRVAGGQRSQSFLGTDFTFADLEGQSPDRWDSKLLRNEVVGGHDDWVIESTPKPAAESAYARTVQWIRKDVKLPEKIEFYDAHGLLKVFTADEIKPIDGFNVATKTHMVNVVKNHSTVMEILEQKNNMAIPDDVFTTRSMQQ